MKDDHCQQNYDDVGFSMEDEMSGRSGLVIKACRECAGPEVVSSRHMCASRDLPSFKKAVNMERGTPVPLNSLITK